MKLLTWMARTFVAGDTIEDAIRNVRKLNEKGIKATLDVLGESVKDKEAAEKAVNDYLDLLEAIPKAGVDSHVSLKLTQMGLDIDTEYCYRNIERIVGKAKTVGNFVRIDMEGTPHTQRTLDIFYRLREKYDNVGIVVQAYLYRTEKDVRDLNKVKAKVRICKGAYKEPADLAIKKMKDIRANFIKLAELLFKDGVYPAIGTHDDKLINWTREYTAANAISADKYELQYLYGIRNKTFRKLAEEGYQVRCYVPFGTHWLPYTLRRLRERKTVIFLVKNFFKR
ncbi:MAG: proline dehydrogenase family protein [Candidatus Aminicenantales bacterium]